MDDALALLQLKDVAYHTQGMARITVLLEVLADIWVISLVARVIFKDLDMGSNKNGVARWMNSQLSQLPSGIGRG